MVLPPDVSELGIRPAVAVRLLDVRLIRDAVQVLVQPVQQEGQQLLRFLSCCFLLLLLVVVVVVSISSCE